MRRCSRSIDGGRDMKFENFVSAEVSKAVSKENVWGRGS